MIIIPKPNYFFFFIIFLCNHHFQHSEAQPATEGYSCNKTSSTYPCEAYAFYRALAPDLLDLASIGDLFSVSRLMISEPSNISSPVTSPLLPNQPLLIPLSCSCNSVNTTLAISSANLKYTIKSGDTFYYVSTNHFQNLTTFQSVEIVNPDLVPTNLSIGGTAVFPVFCKCPDKTHMGNQTNFLISYVFQPSDTLTSVASMFGSTRDSIMSVNGGNIQPLDTIFVPVSRLPRLSQPSVAPAPAGAGKEERKGLVIGLSIAVGILGFLLILICGFWGFRGFMGRKMEKDTEGQQLSSGKEGKGLLNVEVKNLMGDVSGCLDKYKVYGIEELREATDGFDESCIILGSVYKGTMNGEVYAIKKMKWDAYEELKILQKVNHGNLVKLEGFCIDPEDATCYLVYEYLENGSLYSWLQGNKNQKLSWKSRLRIAIDVANGLQYIHEHTRPRVVHKDIKSSNILLDGSMRAKIANFGLAKSGCNAITMHIVGTQGYIAPEYLADGVVSTKMDVFAFGVVLLELISGREAVDEEGKSLWTTAGRVFDGREDKGVKAWMEDVLRGESPPMESVVNVMAVAVACVHKDPTKRPSMVDIVYALCKSDELFLDLSQDGLSPGQVLAR